MADNVGLFIRQTAELGLAGGESADLLKWQVSKYCLMALIL